MGRQPKPLIHRLDERIATGPGCWLWTGAINRHGYGQFLLSDGKRRAAHRVVYEVMVGPIPEGLQLDHLCRNRACVNADHLEPVTSRENTMRGDSPKLQALRWLLKTHCPQGHEYDEANTYRYRNHYTGRPARACRACHRERQARRVARLRAEAAA